MLQEILERWHDAGKPLFMAPKDFKDRILLNMDMEIKLNYLKWLTQGLEIDIFEILSMLILYSRCDMKTKMKTIFLLFCYNQNQTMKRQELNFMLSKLCCAIAVTL